MRRWLLLVLVLLLPLRGWIGDAMAASPLHPAATAAAPAGAPQATPAASDCARCDDMPGHAHAAAVQQGHDPAGAEADSGHALHGGCGNCLACASLALGPGAGAPVLHAGAQAPPVSTHPAFASAERAPVFKPPRG